MNLYPTSEVVYLGIKTLTLNFLDDTKSSSKLTAPEDNSLLMQAAEAVPARWAGIFFQPAN